MSFNDLVWMGLRIFECIRSIKFSTVVLLLLGNVFFVACQINLSKTLVGGYHLVSCLISLGFYAIA